MLKILIIDDEKRTREGIRDNLPWVQIGYCTPILACDGEEALQILASRSPDVVLCDIRMPRMDGVTFATILRQRFPDCQIIFMSGYSDKEYLKAAITLQAVEYVEKPVELPVLEAILRKAAGRSAKQKEKIVSHILTREEIAGFEEALQQTNADNAKKLLRTLNVHMIIQGGEQADYARFAYFQLYSALQNAARKRNFPLFTDRDDASWISKAVSVSDIASGMENAIQVFFNHKNNLMALGDIAYNITRCVEENYTLSTLSINWIAHKLHMTATYLCTVFKAETGKTINQFITQVRLENARDMLRDKNSKLVEVANRCGYEDPNYFAKLFKKKEGVTPSEYRKRYLV